MLRRHIAVVMQDTYLIHGTVAENLRFGKPEATPAELEAAARAANAHEFIQALPQGYRPSLANAAYDSPVDNGSVWRLPGRYSKMPRSCSSMRHFPVLTPRMKRSFKRCSA